MNLDINKSNKLLLYMFTITMMYTFDINGIEARYFVLIFWLFYIVFVVKKVQFMKNEIIFLFILFLLAVYSIFISLINGELNTFWVLRLSRCIFTFIVIAMFLSSSFHKPQDIINSIIFSLFLHSICIVLGIVFPSFKNIILPISQYKKAFYLLRSTGLVSGFDNAGFLCIVGLVIVYLTKDSRKNLTNIFLCGLFSISTVFTSRVNILLLFATLLYILFRENRNNGIIRKLIIILASVLGGSVAFVYWILTTNVSIELRAKMLSAFPALSNLYTQLMNSYTDYGRYTNVIGKHFNLNSMSVIDFFIGSGINAGFTDVGYLKDIYAIGLLGSILQIGLYLKSIFDVKKSISNTSYIWLYKIYFFVVILMFVMEIKMSFIFATTTFEMISIIYIVSLKQKNIKQTNVILER